MVKDPESGYSPGRRGYGWLKMKKALATIDCVVVGVEVGHGKRHGVLSDYTFAVRDGESGRLVHDRQGVQRADGRRDRGDDDLVRGPHHPPVRPLPRGRALKVLVHHLSQYLALEPGDLILTGTPQGVALSGNFPYLKARDLVEIEVDGLGRQRTVFGQD